MIKFKEIIYYETREALQNNSCQYLCPKCPGFISWDRIPCMDLDGRCLTIHRGYICSLCKTVFHKLDDGE